jgi:hypothetical protein
LDWVWSVTIYINQLITIKQKESFGDKYANRLFKLNNSLMKSRFKLQVISKFCLSNLVVKKKSIIRNAKEI